MSTWGKFLAQIVVPAGGLDFGFTKGGAQTVTVPEGVYDSILELAANLEAELQAIDATFAVTVSSVGIVTISCGNAWAEDWATTDDALEATLGYDGTETVAALALVATSQHTHGWYPGVISRGQADGEGLASDTSWTPADEVGTTYAGSGAARRIAPARRAYRRTVRYGCVRRTEAFDRARGPICLADRWATCRLRWYPDRDLGTVAVPGTQADPGYPDYHADGDGDYWLVTVSGEPRFTPLTSPIWWSVEVTLSGEPE